MECNEASRYTERLKGRNMDRQRERYIESNKASGFFFSYHIGQRNVNKHASHSTKDPLRGGFHLTKVHSTNHSNVAKTGRQNVVEQSMFNWHSFA